MMNEQLRPRVIGLVTVLFLLTGCADAQADPATKAAPTATSTVVIPASTPVPPTATYTSIPTSTHTITPKNTPTNTHTPTPTGTPTPTPMPTNTASPTPGPTSTPPDTPTPVPPAAPPTSIPPTATLVPTSAPTVGEDVLRLQVPRDPSFVRDLWQKWNGSYVLYAHKQAGIKQFRDLNGREIFYYAEYEDDFKAALEFGLACHADDLDLSANFEVHQGDFCEKITQNSDWLGFMDADTEEFCRPWVWGGKAADLIRIEFE